LEPKGQRSASWGDHRRKRGVQTRSLGGRTTGSITRARLQGSTYRNIRSPGAGKKMTGHKKKGKEKNAGEKKKDRRPREDEKEEKTGLFQEKRLLTLHT